MNENATTLPMDLAVIAREIYAERGDIHALAEAISTKAKQLMPTADGVSIVIANKETIERTVAIDDFAGTCDSLQMSLGEGPSLHSVTHHETVLMADVSRDVRWRRFAQVASAAGAGAVLCLPFEAGANRTGTVNMYSHTLGGFDAQSKMIGGLFTAHAALTFIASRENEQLHLAAESRDVIGQAKGMIMERFGIDADQAFALLRRFSQDSNIRIAVLARQVVEAGSDVLLPETDPSPE